MDHALLIENYGCRDGELAEDSREVAESSGESPLLCETLTYFLALDCLYVESLEVLRAWMGQVL